MFLLIVFASISLMFEVVEAFNTHSYEYPHDNENSYDRDKARGMALEVFIGVIICCCCSISSITPSVLASTLSAVGGRSLLGVVTTKNHQQGGRAITLTPNPQTTNVSRTNAGEDDVETANSCFEFTA
ncbi:hypothetical protein M3Y98_00720500 [Aphelenchoides besseyi]|nr:hypothetical protein M3Y98_00720500 [Aphelenchoides besseyi]KAI6210230.1 hypothetical protein M3Y96_00305800 [Aphelenchoides besseyi]